jgi:hypothetical protein
MSLGIVHKQEKSLQKWRIISQQLKNTTTKYITIWLYIIYYLCPFSALVRETPYKRLYTLVVDRLPTELSTEFVDM